MLSQPDKNKRSTSDSGHGAPSIAFEIPKVPRLNLNGAPRIPTRTQIRADSGFATKDKCAGNVHIPPSPSRPIPALPSGSGRSWSGKGIAGKDISNPVLNHGMHGLMPTR